MNYNTIIFDLGGVLIDWNPVYLYRKVFTDEGEMKTFLQEVCHPAWNRQQDGGRPFAEAVAEQTALFPHYKDYIEFYHQRWEEMLGGPIEENVRVLEDLHRNPDLHVHAITNWSAETFPIAERKYPFLEYFEDIIVSGKLGMLKPDAVIFEVLLDRHSIPPERAIFIDDVQENIAGAEALGIHGIHLTPETDLRKELQKLGVLSS